MKKIVALSAFAALTVSGAAAFAASPETQKSAVDGLTESYRAGKAKSTAEGDELELKSQAIANKFGVKVDEGCEGSVKTDNGYTILQNGKYSKTVVANKFEAQAACKALNKAKNGGKSHKGGKLAHTGSPAVAASLASLLAVVTGAGVVAYRKFA